MSSLEIYSISPGDGKTFPAPGDTVTIHYVGTLETKDGQQFDSSRSRGKPFTCQIGVGRVIKGWDQGVVQLSLGQKAYLKCPPELAYGQAGYPNAIPPNATLWFEVELLKIQTS
ncbi:hypothetical protein O181_053724 [Austropuccinia psidii MF-1]|uniref:peptidylprolyl isomerase n=1 Tax=Austropuccinia psidii MF-1 TaxID=1389203 RepID=A0A9Q3E377_9BASI|nr:hypothetical protein [Austropuccinia psidii MF-1]